MDFLTNRLRSESLIESVVGCSREKQKKVFLVGGYLRDGILERTAEAHDIDFCLKDGAVDFARAVAKRVKGFFVLLDQEHGCARVVVNKNGTAYTLDFADFRGKDIKEDLLHRDFTVNTLALDISKIQTAKNISSILLDYYGGLADLRDKKIDITAKENFVDDPLRIVRAFSLSCILDCVLTDRTKKQIRKDRKKLSVSAFERVRDEFFKILGSERAYEYIKLMDSFGVLEMIVPEIRLMKDITQGPYHHLDVWNHSLETVKQLEKVFNELSADEKIRRHLGCVMANNRKRLSLLKLTALLHDIGKPQTLKIEEGRTRFHGHEHVGRRMVRNISERLKLSTKENDALELMILWHLRPGYLADFKMPTARAVFRYFRDTADEGISILLLSLADQRATCGPLTNARDRKHHEKIIKELIDYYFKKQDEKPLERLITGNDLIKKLKLKPAPIFSKILNAVEEAQALKKITTKQEALELAKRLVGKQRNDK